MADKPCAKYICNCSEIQDVVDEYNEAIDRLKSAADAMDLNGKLKTVVEKINAGLKEIDASLPVDRPPGDDKCGCKAEMESTVEKLFSGKKSVLAGNVYRACCNDGGTDDPWELDAQTPCGKDVDNALEGTVLFNCDNPISIPEGIDSFPDISKIRCVKDTSKKCTEPGGSVYIVKEGEEPEGGGGRPRVIMQSEGNIDVVTDEIQKTLDYLDIVSQAANGKFNVGGQYGNLQVEACVSRLLHRACIHKFNKPDRPNANLLIAGCGKAAENMDYRCGSQYDCCNKLIYDLAMNSLTFGHGKFYKEGSDAHTYNGIPDCGKNKIKVINKIFIAGNVTQARAATEIQNYLNDLNKKFPGGCRDVGTTGTNNPLKDFEIKDIYTCRGGDDPECAKWNTSSVGDGLSDQDRLLVVEKQERLRVVETQLRDLKLKLNIAEADFTAARAEWYKHYEKDQNSSETEKAWEVLGRAEVKKNRLTQDVEALQNQKETLEEEIKNILDNPVFPGGSMVTFEYRYCPANSTPGKSPFNPAGGQTAGPGAGGGAGQTHRNFYDLINNIALALQQNNPCGGLGPLTSIYENCLGETQGRNPFDPGAQKPPNTGPTVNIGPPGESSPCSDNDSVRFMPGIWDMGSASRQCDRDELKRPECIQRMQRVLKTWDMQARPWRNKLKRVNDVLGNVRAAALIIIETIDGIRPPEGDECGSVNTDEANTKINKALKAIEKATTALEELDEI